jgi:hypothetical protein
VSAHKTDGNRTLGIPTDAVHNKKDYSLSLASSDVHHLSIA